MTITCPPPPSKRLDDYEFSIPNLPLANYSRAKSKLSNVTSADHRTNPANTKHLYNICTTSSIVQMLYKCFELSGKTQAPSGLCMKRPHLKKYIFSSKNVFFSTVFFISCDDQTQTRHVKFSQLTNDM